MMSATALASAAQAAELLTVESDKSKMISVSAMPGAVIVGNPSIADVSLQGTKVFVHGKSFGETNLIILDLDGNQIANFDVVTKHSADSTVALFKAGNRFSYTCMPNCEAQMQIGDPKYWMSDEIGGEVKTKFEIATGQKSAEADAPKAPQ